VSKLQLAKDFGAIINLLLTYFTNDLRRRAYCMGPLIDDLLLLLQVAGSWHLGLYLCLAWTGSDVILSTTSIMHLCAIALYRYVGIVYPLRMRSAQEARHVAALVVPAWTIAVALSIPFVVQGITHSGNSQPPYCLLIMSPQETG